MTSDLMMGLLVGFFLGAVIAGACVVYLWFRSERRLMSEEKVERDRIIAAWRRSNRSWAEMYMATHGVRAPINVTPRKPRCGFCGSYAWPNCCDRARS